MAAAGTSTGTSTSGGTSSIVDTQMWNTGGGNDGNNGEGNGDGTGKENKKKKEGEDEDPNRNGNNPPKKGVQVFDAKTATRQEFEISYNQSTYTTIEGIPLIRKLMKEMQRKDPSIVFYPTNKTTNPQPRTINNVEEDFPNENEAHLFQEFFYSIKTPKQMIYKFDVTMVLADIEMKQRMKSYLNMNRLYMNSIAIDAGTTVAGWF